MNRKYKVDSKSAIALAVVCMVLLTSIVGSLANQTTAFPNKKSSARECPAITSRNGRLCWPFSDFAWITMSCA
jgi:hypothetical protein